MPDPAEASPAEAPASPSEPSAEAAPAEAPDSAPSSPPKVRDDTVVIDRRASAEPEESAEDAPEAEGAEAERPEGQEEGSEERTPEPTPEPEEDAEAQAVADPSDEVDGDAEGEGVQEEGAPSAAEPLVVQVDGKPVEVRGAVETRVSDSEGNPVDAYVIPKESWRRFVQPRLVDRGAVLQRERELESKIRDLDPQRHPDVLKAQVLVEELESALTDEASFQEFLENYDARKELLGQKVENRVLKAQSEAREERDSELQQEQMVEAWADTIATDLPQQVDQLIEEAGLPERAAAAFRQRVFENAERFYHYAANDEQARQLGLRPGDIGRDNQALLQELRYAVSLAEMGRGDGSGNGSTPEARRAKRENDAALGRAGAKKPPKVPASGDRSTTKPPGDTGSGPQIESKEDFRKWGMGI